jgi:hypothetical protein
MHAKKRKLLEEKKSNELKGYRLWGERKNGDWVVGRSVSRYLPVNFQ